MAKLDSFNNMYNRNCDWNILRKKNRQKFKSGSSDNSNISFVNWRWNFLKHKMKYKKSIIGKFLILILLINIWSCNNSRKSEKVDFKIIVTSDIHGAIFPYDFQENKASLNSLAQIATYIKQERANKNQNVILLDNGDILQGNPAVYFNNFIDTTVTHICSATMNYLDYDAATIGNHDIEPGHEVYDKIVKESDFPWLAANAINKKTKKPYFNPYKIFNRKGVKIAVLGLTTPSIPFWLPENLWEGIEFEDMIVSAKKWVKIIKEKEKPDIIIGLFHSGIDFTFNNETAETQKNENASLLVAQQVEGFDIIFVGHDHKGWNFYAKNPKGKDVLIMGPTSSANDFAVADISFADDEKSISGNIVKTSNYKADKDFTEKFKPYFISVKKFVLKPLGALSKSMSIKKAFFGDTPFIDLIHNLQLEISGADISFAAIFSFNAEINKGKLYMRDMFKLYKYENLLYTIQLSGKEVKDVLEYSYSLWFNDMKSENDHILNFSDKTSSSGKKYLSTPYFNFESAEGINYIVDVSKPKGEKIKILSMTNGEAFDMDKKYLVAVNSYRGCGGGGHLTEGGKIPQEKLAERLIKSTDRDIRYYLIKWIEKNKTINPKTNNNWKVIPENWYNKAKDRDYKILFGD